MHQQIISFKDVYKTYYLGQVEVPALKRIDTNVSMGEFMAIAGPSGSGKTTMLNMIGCVDTASSGSVIVCGKDTATLSDKELTDLRLYNIGFIFQTFNLIQDI